MKHQLPNIINLPNRDGLNITLQLYDESSSTYRLIMDNGYYIRYEKADIDNDEYEYLNWIDPSGGPMLHIGYTVDNLTVSEIKIKKEPDSKFLNIFITVQ